MSETVQLVTNREVKQKSGGVKVMALHVVFYHAIALGYNFPTPIALF